MTRQHAISLLMPVRNAESWIREALRSVLEQTRIPDQLVIVDDGSTDASMSIVEELHQPWFTVVNGPGRGVAAALQTGLAAANGDLVARLDADDIALPHRLALQEAAFCDRDLVLCGGWASLSPSRMTRRSFRPPTSPSEVARYAGLSNPFVHSSVMFRRDAVERVGGYRTESATPYPEDYDLWIRLIKEGVCRNLPHELVVYRTHAAGVTMTNPRDLGEAAVGLAARTQVDVLGMGPPSREAMAILRAYHRVRRSDDTFSLGDVRAFIARLASAGDLFEKGLRLDRMTVRGLYQAAIMPNSAKRVRSWRQRGSSDGS